MRAQDGIGFELFQVAGELAARAAGQGAAQPAQPAGDPGIVRLAEDHAPKFRGPLDELHVTVFVDLLVEWREKFDEVEPLDGVAGTQPAPGFLQGGGGGNMPAPAVTVAIRMRMGPQVAAVQRD